MLLRIYNTAVHKNDSLALNRAFLGRTGVYCRQLIYFLADGPPSPRRTQRTRRKNKLGDRSGVSGRGPVLPTLAAIDDEPMEGFYPNRFFCSCLSSASSVSSVVRAGLCLRPVRRGLSRTAW